MDYELLREDILSDIVSTEEGKQDLLDYASGKVKDARKILEKYSDIFFQRTGQKIDFYDRHLADRAEILLRKDIPNMYTKWRDKGTDSLAGIQELTMAVLRHYEDKLDEKSIKGREISERIDKEVENEGINEYASNQIAERIINAIENSRYYTARIMGMDYRSNDIVENLSNELKKIMNKVKLEEIKGILDKSEEEILQKIDKTIDENLELLEKRTDNSKKEEMDFKNRMQVDVNYTEIIEKYSKPKQEDKSRNKDDDSRDGQLPTDIII